MSELPWYPLYPADFIGGCVKANLNAHEIALYTIALHLMYERGRPIERDHAWLAKMCGMSTRKAGQVISSLIQKEKLREKDGLLTNDRFEKEEKKRRKNADKTAIISPVFNKNNDITTTYAQMLRDTLPNGNASASAAPDPETELFDVGKRLLGKSAGGLIAKLVKARGVPGARAVIDEAADRQDPREWVGACLREDSAILRAKAWADRNREEIRREMEELERAKCV